MIPIHTLALVEPKRRPRHPHWVHANEIRHLTNDQVTSGRCALVRVAGNNRLGIYNKDSLMTVRYLPKNIATSLEDQGITEENFLAALLCHLQTLRSQKLALFSFARESAFRWSHGDSDGLPGIVIDDYHSFIVLQSGCAAGDFLVDRVAAALSKIDDRPILERSSGQVRAMEGLPERTRWLRAAPAGAAPLTPVRFANLNLNFDPLRAQKTGLFLDQRLNLDTLAQLAPALNANSLLDICCYAGAWSATAAREGTRQFTLIDTDARALTMAEQNIRANAKASDVSIETLHGDLFETLSREKQGGRQWNIVVADPPAFAKSRKHIPEATQAYARLIRLASRLVAPEGLLVLCSCSRNMEAANFEEIAFRQLTEGDWVLVRRGQQSPDHSVAAEGSDYLKCLFFIRRGCL